MANRILILAAKLENNIFLGKRSVVILNMKMFAPKPFVKSYLKEMRKLDTDDMR